MLKINNKPDDPNDIAMTAQELNILSELDSRQYGYLLLNASGNAKKKILIMKAVKYLQLMVEQAMLQQKEQQINSEYKTHLHKKISIDPKTWVKLGHFHLLLDQYRMALSAYQMFYKTQAENHWMEPTFLYGLGMVYFHYNAYQWSVKVFRQLLYVAPGFQRSNEVHVRLGLMFKVSREYESSLKHLQLALADNSPCNIEKPKIKFHIAHLFEIQGKVKAAKERYELLLRDRNISNLLKADICRQLGWLYHCQETLGEKGQRIQIAIQCLQQAIAADPYSGQTLYLLGRCYGSVGKVHDAFIAYRNSVEKSEGNADTWCSIGVLYQQQSQPMDALQAYICAVQLDKCHTAAWANLGILFESVGQVRDAYACYLNSNNSSQRNGSGCKSVVEETYVLAKTVAACKVGGVAAGKQLPSLVGFMNPHLTQRIQFLQTHLSNGPMPSITNSRRQLLSIEEAWNLPISAEMSSRQQQQQGGSGGIVIGGASAVVQQSCSGTTAVTSCPAQQPYVKADGAAQPGPPPPYPTPTGVSCGGTAAFATATIAASNKRFKTERPMVMPIAVQQQQDHQPTKPAAYLTQQQLQHLQFLQQNASNLNAQQQSTMQQLQHQYRLMQQHQQQLRQQQQLQQRCYINPIHQSAKPQPSLTVSPAPQVVSSTSTGTTTTTATIPTGTDTGRVIQPALHPPVPNCTKELMGNSDHQLDVSEEDIQDILSHKDLATTLAENLLKHFGSEDMEIKEEPLGPNDTLSSGPFSPSNMDVNLPKQEILGPDDIKAGMKNALDGNVSPILNIFTLKSEIPWDIDSVNSSDRRPESEFCITMDSKAILEMCNGKMIFTVWSYNRTSKSLFLIQNSENSVQNLLNQVSTKFNIIAVKLVLNKNGSQLDDYDILFQMDPDTIFLALEEDQAWTPEPLNILSPVLSSTVTNSTILDFELFPPTENEVENIITMDFYEVPWSRIPSQFIEACEQGNRKDKTLVQQIIQIVVNDMRQIKTAIPKQAFLQTANKMIAKYPRMFRDVDEDGIVLGDGTHSMFCKLAERNSYLNRPHKRTSNTPMIVDKSKKKAKNAMVLCSHWQPEINNSNDDEFANQRLFLNNLDFPPTIAEIKEKWPTLLQQDGILQYFELLTSVSVKSVTLLFKTRMTKIFEFAARKKILPYKKNFVCIIDCLEILTCYFKEDMQAYVRELQAIEEINNIEVVEPCIVHIGNVYYVYMETELIMDTDDSTDAFLTSFALYFNFNLKYPKKVSGSLELIQRYFFKIHPDIGSKAQEALRTKRKVLSLINKLQSI